MRRSARTSSRQDWLTRPDSNSCNPFDPGAPAEIYGTNHSLSIARQEPDALPHLVQRLWCSGVLSTKTTKRERGSVTFVVAAVIVLMSLDNSGFPAFDGLLYPSRNNFPATCIALFYRARAKVVVVDDLPLVQHVDWPAFVNQYRIGVAKV